VSLGPLCAYTIATLVELQLSHRSIAAGAFFTLFIARPSSALSDLTRWPDEIDSSDACAVCGKKEVNPDDPLLECERCEDGCHLSCHDPPLTVSPLAFPSSVCAYSMHKWAPEWLLGRALGREESGS
jgi:hypothetical protein